MYIIYIIDKYICNIYNIYIMYIIYIYIIYKYIYNNIIYMFMRQKREKFNSVNL